MRLASLFLAAFLCVSGRFSPVAMGQAPMLVETNVIFRVMAANLSSGSFQRYESPGLNIMKGLKPDVVAIQEFNYSSTSNGLNTVTAFREMVDKTFGTNFTFFRESGKSIPNGVISRFPILTNGVWDDVELTDREFVWARLDIPGTNGLFVVSVHLKASSGSDNVTRRATQASNLKSLIQTHFPANAFVVVAGDMNTHSSSEACLNTFKTFLSDSPIPTDAISGGNTNTNAGRSERYDYVFPSFSLNSNRVATVIGSQSFPNGLVFDSRVFSPLSSVTPAIFSDSGASGMQHMAVVKDFKINYTTTNFVPVPPPALRLFSSNVIRWNGISNLSYSVQATTNLSNFDWIGSATSITTNFSFTNQSSQSRLFFRVVYP